MSVKKRKRTYQDVLDLFGSAGYKVLIKEEEFVNWSTKVPYICNKGHEWSTYPKDFERGVRCAKCRGLAPYTKEEVSNYVSRYKYQLISDYKNSRDDIKLLCPLGHEFSTSFYGFKHRGYRCRRCKATKGERSIFFILDKYLPNGIDYKAYKRVKFKGSIYEFDFFIDKGEGLFIEFDGDLHEKSDDFYGGEEALKNYQYRDMMKGRYVDSINAHLLRIHYTVPVIGRYNLVYDFLLNHGIELLPMNEDDLANAEYYISERFNIKEIVDYYKNHSMRETVKKFKINEGTVGRYFKELYGCSKQEYNRNRIREEVAEYYLNNSNKATQKKFGLSDATIQKYFKEVYGTDKTNYLQGYTKEEVAKYYLNHSSQETANHFGIHKTTAHKFFKEVYGMTKTEYLNKINGINLVPNQTINKQIGVLAISPEGKEYITYNQTEFAREHGLQQSNIAHCLSGRVKTHKGWRFKYLEDLQ